ncbi:hypothetical protein V8E54_013414 [Elaphomyces granulatus]
MDTRYETSTRDIGGVVRERGNDEPNPLLQWAEWDKYLQGCEWADLLALTERPNPAEEPVASAIWTAMEEVAYISNETVRQAAFATRLQATRIRETEQRDFALQAIPDKRNVIKYVRPWQGIMMFFVRKKTAFDFSKTCSRSFGWSWRRQSPRLKGFERKRHLKSTTTRPHPPLSFNIYAFKLFLNVFLLQQFVNDHGFLLFF